MLPALQPSRPKPPQQSAPPTIAPQQRRAAHESYQQAQQPGPLLPGPPARPRSQIEAMPPFRPAQHPAPMVYDSAIRHPVFFTQNLKKPPFPVPQIASRGWSPVANGYVMEQQRAMGAEPRTKL